MREIIYYSEQEKSGISDDTLTVYIPSVYTKEELLDWYAKLLSFPSYFGRNWDALIDLLRILDWLEQKNIRIIHQSVTALPENVLADYMSIVYIICTFWRLYPSEHQLFFLFDINEKEKLEKVFWEEAHKVEELWQSRKDRGENDGAFLSELRMLSQKE